MSAILPRHARTYPALRARGSLLCRRTTKADREPTTIDGRFFFTKDPMRPPGRIYETIGSVLKSEKINKIKIKRRGLFIFVN